MTTTIQAVYRGGMFHPTSPPPELPDGTPVELTMSVTPPDDPLHPAAVLARIRAIAAVREVTPPVDDGLVVSENVGEILYGGPRGAL